MSAYLERQAAAIFPEDFDLIEAQIFALKLLPDHLVHQGSIFGSNHVRDIQSECFCAAIAGQTLSSLVNRRVVSFEIVRVNDLVRVLNQRQIKLGTFLL